MNMWTTVLGYAVDNPRIAEHRYFGTFARTILMLWIILWLLIRSSYQGALYTHLQAQRFTSAFDTIEKIQASDCKIIVPRVVQSTLKRLFNEKR